jgi:hypothetical protein
MLFTYFVISFFVTITSINIYSMAERPIPLALHAAQLDIAESEAIVNKMKDALYPRAECIKALQFAFKKMRENPNIQHHPWQEEQTSNALLLTKEMFQIYRDIASMGSDELGSLCGAKPDSMESEAADKLVYAAMNLASEEKSKIIRSLAIQKLILCCTTLFLTTACILTNLATYYGSCHKS